MTIKWVKSDPLVMNGEPFCYGTRLTVRNLLEMRAAGNPPARLLAEHPELRRIGVAEAFLFASQNPSRYTDFIATDGSLIGPGFTAEEAAGLPAHLRTAAGVVTTAGEPTPSAARR